MKFPKQFSVEQYCRFVEIRRGIDLLWEIVSRPPAKLPSRRKERPLPKAA